MFTDARELPVPDPRLRVAVVAGDRRRATDAGRLVAFLQRLGVPVRVFAPGSPGGVGEMVPVPSVGLPWCDNRLALGLPPSAKRELCRFAPTLVHLWSADLPGLSALRWARLRGVPVVATCPAPPGDSLRALPAPARWLAWHALRWVYRRCVEVYVPAASVAAELRDNGVEAEIAETPPGVDAGRFHPRRSVARVAARGGDRGRGGRGRAAGGARGRRAARDVRAGTRRPARQRPEVPRAGAGRRPRPR